MRDFRSILNIIGLLLCIESIAMLIPMIFDLYYKNDDWVQFFYSSLITFFIGIILNISFRKKNIKLGIREAFVLTISSWIIISIFGSLPFIYSSSNLTYTDAFFESVSGITTTGSTVISNLEYLSEGILIWRSLLQWFGGIGIIVLAMAILPTLQIGGMQLLHMEHDDPYEKTIPKVNRFVLELFFLYVFLSVICAFLYFLNGMSGFDSIIHSMTTISTGGFSNYNQSFSYFNSFQIEIVSVIFMIIGSLPFVLYLQFLHRQRKFFFKDDQIKLFFLIILVIVLISTVWLSINQSDNIFSSFRLALFNIISILTGTGYSSSNFSNWGSFGTVIMMIIMFIGGCAGSTTGGIKIFRLQILFRGARTQIKKLTQPHAVLVMRFNGKTVNDNTYSSVMGFFFMYILLFIFSAISLSFFNLDFLTAFSAAASAISNVGPGIGDIIGPLGNYSTLDNGAKWILAITMVIGRLEIFTVLVLLSLNFWKN
ncbi:MAG: TrkH family potassium uptake protein [Alphaproteobacteria bacterium]